MFNTSPFLLKRQKLFLIVPLNRLDGEYRYDLPCLSFAAPNLSTEEIGGWAL